MRKAGRELVGPCPHCGGRDRFRVTAKGGAFCRQCAPDGKAGADALRRLIEAAGFDWPENAPGDPSERRRAPDTKFGPDDTRKGGKAAQGRSGAESRAVRGQPAGQSDTSSPRIDRAAAIWAASVAADATPARRYLAGRLAWPPDGIGPDLPASVRWIPASAWPRPGPGLPGLPREAAGAILFRLGDPVRGVQAEALTAEARRIAPKRWRKTVGDRAPFDAGGAGPDIVLAEGQVTALACRWLHPGARCFALAGPLDKAEIAMREIAPHGPPAAVTIEADGDLAGVRGARRARDAIPGARVVWRRTGDAADELAVEVGERVALIQESGSTEAEAIRIAWRDRLAGLTANPTP